MVVHFEIEDLTDFQIDFLREEYNPKQVKEFLQLAVKDLGLSLRV